MNKLLFILLFIPLISFGQNSNSDKVITIIGMAEMDIEPDIITISMTVKESENSGKESDVVKMENRISNFLKSIGVKQENFTFDRYSANTQFSLSSGSKFKLNKSYKLVIDRPTLIDTIVSKCFEYGLENIFVSKLEHSKIDSIQNALLAKAIQVANQKAKIISVNAGINLGAVVSVNESYQLVGNRADLYYNNDLRLEEVVVTGYGTSKKSRVGSTISLNKLHLNKTVIVKYEIK